MKPKPLIVISLLALLISCGEGVKRTGIPAGAQSALDQAIEDIDAGRYEKLYQEASDEWRSQASLYESQATFQKLRDKLGKVRTRTLQTEREEQTSTAPVRGHSVIVEYQTTFEHGDGMERFTLIEHQGSWYLAGYFVSSTQLK